MSQVEFNVSLTPGLSPEEEDALLAPPEASTSAITVGYDHKTVNDNAGLASSRQEAMHVDSQVTTQAPLVADPANVDPTVGTSQDDISAELGQLVLRPQCTPINQRAMSNSLRKRYRRFRDAGLERRLALAKAKETGKLQSEKRNRSDFSPRICW